MIVEERARDLDSPARPARPDPPGRRLPPPPLPQPDPRLARRPGDGSASTTSATSTEPHYRPDGAVLVVVGDVEPERGARPGRGALRRARPGATRRAPEPTSTSPGRWAAATSRWSSPSRWRGACSAGTPCPAGHPDGPALDVLSDLLTCGRRSRLWDDLVERGRLATWVEPAQEGARLRRAVPRPGRGRPRRRARPGRAGRSPRPSPSWPTTGRPPRSWPGRGTGSKPPGGGSRRTWPGLAAGLGHVALWDDWRAWQAEHRAALAVEADDIRRVASTYLTDAEPDRRLVARPGPAGRSTVLLPAEAIPPRRPAPAAPPARRAPDRAWRSRPAARGWPTTARAASALPNGLRLITERRPGTGIVALELFVDAGLLREAKPGLAFLTGRLLEEGTHDPVGRGAGRGDRGRRRDARRRLDRGLAPGPRRGPAAGRRAAGRRGPPPRLPRRRPPLGPAPDRGRAARRPRRPGLPRRPDLPRPGLRRPPLRPRPARHVPRHRPADARRRPGPPRRHFAPDNAFLVAVGDFDPRRLRTPGPAPTSGAGSRAGRGPPPLPRRVRLGAAQGPPGGASRRAGPHRARPPGDRAATTPTSTPWPCSTTSSAAGPGFTDRLSRILRDELGLAYSVGGGMTDSADVAPGLFRVYVGTMPDEADRAVAAVVEQVRAMHAGRLLRRRGRPRPPLPGRLLGLRLSRPSSSAPSGSWSSSAGASASTSRSAGPSGSPRSPPARSAAPPAPTSTPSPWSASSSAPSAAAA